jgi:hypothetical protein
MSAYPPEAVRPGLPSAAFVEIYETLLPRQDDDHLIRSMTAMLAERTRRGPQEEAEEREIAGRSTYLIRSGASLPTGEQLDVKLWVTGSRDHIVALAQANLEGDPFIDDSAVEAILRSVVWPNWSRDEALFGSWRHIERKPSGPLTEVIERSLDLSPDGQYRRLRTSSLELPDEAEGQSARPKEVKERNGQWYSREGELMLSAGLRGYRVRKTEVGTSKDELALDGIVWRRVQ